MVTCTTPITVPMKTAVRPRNHESWTSVMWRDHSATTTRPSTTKMRPREGKMAVRPVRLIALPRSEEHTSELQSLMRISYAVFCLKKKKNTNKREKSDSQLHTVESR